MDKDMIFFSTDGRGLTSTSANHVANMAKEMVRGRMAELENLEFFSTDVALIGESNSNRLVFGTSEEMLDNVIDILFHVAKAKSLIAWLREAIKAKEALIDRARKTTLEEFAAIEGVSLQKQPEPKPEMTDDDYIATLSLKERCRYYEVETLASTLGKEIHPGGAFSDARDTLLNKLERPHSVSGEGRDTLIYTYSPSVGQEKVDDVFFHLQKLYREAQAEVNVRKHDCHKAVTEENISRNADYVARLSDWTNARQLLEGRRSEYIKSRVKQLGEMKILIPDSLQPIYEEVSRLGKKKDSASEI